MSDSGGAERWMSKPERSSSISPEPSGCGKATDSTYASGLVRFTIFQRTR